MDKKAFLLELRQSLSVLQEEELQDIISEYEQHIDMKVKSGLSEEEAIADFGGLAQLKAEILEAYHVRADFNAPPNHGLLKRDRFHLLAREGEEPEVFIKLKEGLKRAGKAVGKGFVWGRRQIGRPFSWVLNRWKKEGDAAQTGQERIGWIQKKKEGQERRAMEKAGHKGQAPGEREKGGRGFVGSAIYGIGNGVGKGARWCGCGIIWCVRMGWNAFCVGASLLVGLLGLVCLYGLGVLVVLLSQGYPLFGITVGCFGLVLCLFSLSGFGFTLLWRLKRQGTAEDVDKWEPEIHRERTPQQEGDSARISGLEYEMEVERHG